MKLKVCGMKYHENIKEVSNLKPDYMGFIFHEPSPRFMDSQIPNLPKSIQKVGVFVNASTETVLETAETHQLDVLQLHGNETVEYCLELRKKAPKMTLIKVFSIKDHFDFELLAPFEPVVDFFLFDTKGKLPGGNGFTFNWKALEHYNATKPYFLSGGIGLKELPKLKAFFKLPASKHCIAIDVNSQFEIEPGLKDIQKLEQFKSEL